MNNQKPKVTKEIKLIYFAKIRQLTNIDQEIINTQARTAAEVYTELQKKYDFNFPEHYLKVAINEEYSTFETKLKTGDTLVFIPPVAGG
jgi:molybdopterin converting factor subunit 1